MAAAANMPNIKSGKVLQISELDTWSPDEIHGNAVRILGRYVAFPSKFLDQAFEAPADMCPLACFAYLSIEFRT